MHKTIKAFKTMKNTESTQQAKKHYLVTTLHHVCIDDYEQGEQQQVNSYEITSKQKTETIKQAIENHFNNTLYYSFDFSKAEINEEDNVMYWSNLVDNDNSEANEEQRDKWTKGEIVLYSNNTTISISEIINLKF